MLKNILNSIIPVKEKIFFDQFRKAASMCEKGAKLFNVVVNDDFSDDYFVEARDLKHQSDDLTREILAKVNTTLITPIDRDDIQKLNNMFNDISRLIAKATLILRTYCFKRYPDHLKQQAKTLLEACHQLNCITDQFEHYKKIKNMTDSHEKMNLIEKKGDEILYHAMVDLFSGNHDTLTVIKLKDIYKNIERALDKCFDISDIMLTVALKLQ